MSQIYSSDTVIDNPVTVAGGIIDASGSSVSVTNFPATQPVSGTVSVGNFPATQPVSGSVNVGNFPATQAVSGTVSIAGTVNVLTAVASTATLTITVATANTDTMVLAANVNRKSAIIFIPKTSTSLKYGTGASATSFTFLTGSANTTLIVTGYTGQINVYGSGQSINATELV